MGELGGPWKEMYRAAAQKKKSRDEGSATVREGERIGAWVVARIGARCSDMAMGTHSHGQFSLRLMMRK